MLRGWEEPAVSRAGIAEDQGGTRFDAGASSAYPTAFILGGNVEPANRDSNGGRTEGSHEDRQVPPQSCR